MNNALWRNQGIGRQGGVRDGSPGRKGADTVAVQ